mmetsp:Transcript_13004/g.19813  ORF Transcript_13004/g.19813 Transcript_13004/m.19813 type:complete len:188 (+) Transcript_13004:166-729(+)
MLAATTRLCAKAACNWQNHDKQLLIIRRHRSKLFLSGNNNKPKRRQQPFSSSSNKQTQTQNNQTWYQYWTAPVEIPPRYTLKWYGEMTLLCTVFAITGSSTMFLVRPAMNEVLGLKGSMKDGPWTYRLCSIVIMTPIYPILLVCTGTLFGRHVYFRHFAVKMFSRFGIPAELMDKNFKANAKGFRKW